MAGGGGFDDGGVFRHLEEEAAAQRRHAGFQRRFELAAETADLRLLAVGEGRLQQPAPVAQRGAVVAVALVDLQRRRERLTGRVELLQQEVDAAEELLGVAEDGFGCSIPSTTLSEERPGSSYGLSWGELGSLE